MRYRICPFLQLKLITDLGCEIFRLKPNEITEVRLHMMLLSVRAYNSTQNRRDSFSLKRDSCTGSIGSRDSTVGITAGYGLDNRRVGVRVTIGSKIVSIPCRPDRLWGQRNLLYNGFRGLFPAGREADRLPPNTAKVKEMWIYTSLPHTSS
jgi:hypothetical protein